MTGAKENAACDKQTVFVVDDDSSVCEALRDLIESAGLAVRHFASSEDFLDSWNSEMPGCLVLDVRLPGITGMELQSRMADAGQTIPIIIMTAHGDIPMVRKALKSGAVEFLTKPFHDDELLQAIDQAFESDRAIRVARGLVQSIQSRFDTLSPRERQVMELVTAGMTNKEIAADLDLSIVTVKLYRGQVMEKMKAESLAELVKMSQWIRS